MYLSDYLCIGYIILNNNSNSDKNIHNFRYFTLILTHIISHVSTRHVRLRVCWKCLVWRSLYCTVCKDDFCAKTIFVQRLLFVVRCYAMAYTLVRLRPVSWILFYMLQEGAESCRDRSWERKEEKVRREKGGARRDRDTRRGHKKRGKRDNENTEETEKGRAIKKEADPQRDRVWMNRNGRDG